MKKKTKVKAKRKVFPSKTHTIIIFAFLIAAIATLCFYVILKIGDMNTETFVVRGEVTAKQTSCAFERLREDGTVERGSGVCDAGNNITVNEMSIATGGGSLDSRLQRYVSDISSVHAGDDVEVRYVKDEFGHASTNCEACYVKKASSSKPETQVLIPESHSEFELAL